jgi:hypothetical protein
MLGFKTAHQLQFKCVGFKVKSEDVYIRNQDDNKYSAQSNITKYS